MNLLNKHVTMSLSLNAFALPEGVENIRGFDGDQDRAGTGRYGLGSHTDRALCLFGVSQLLFFFFLIMFFS